MTHRYVIFDESALAPLAEVDRYRAATDAIEQARQAVSDTAAYRDAIVAAMVEARPYRGGPAEVARLLGIPTATVSTHTRKHQERTMSSLINPTIIMTFIPNGAAHIADVLEDEDNPELASLIARFRQVRYETDEVALTLREIHTATELVSASDPAYAERETALGDLQLAAETARKVQQRRFEDELADMRSSGVYFWTKKYGRRRAALVLAHLADNRVPFRPYLGEMPPEPTREEFAALKARTVGLWNEED